MRLAASAVGVDVGVMVDDHVNDNPLDLSARIDSQPRA